MKTTREHTIIKSMMVACIYLLGWTIGEAPTSMLLTLLLGVLSVGLVSVCFVIEEDAK